MWVDYRGSLSTVYNDGEIIEVTQYLQYLRTVRGISIHGQITEVYSAQSIQSTL